MHGIRHWKTKKDKWKKLLKYALTAKLTSFTPSYSHFLTDEKKDLSKKKPLLPISTKIIVDYTR